MLDIHPPHHAASTWRDFFIHIATIVIGLLIALCLEGMVEWSHHRHLVNEARETLRHEIVDNQTLLTKDLASLKQDDMRLHSNLAILTRRRANSKQETPRLDTQWDWEGMQNSAWQTAQATGALALMPYSEVQTFADAYNQQSIVEQNANTYLALHNRAFTPLMREYDLGKLTPADLDRLIDGNSEAATQEKFLFDLAHSLQRSYTNALKSR